MTKKKLVFSALLCSGVLAMGACGTRSDNDRGRAAGSMSSRAQTSQVQQALKAKGYDPGSTDNQTQEALRKFQQANGLPATGKLDAQTAKALGVATSGNAATGSGAGSSSGSTRPNPASGESSDGSSRSRSGSGE